MDRREDSEQFISLVETLEILLDQDFLMTLKKSLREAEQGELIPWERVKAELELLESE
jgi:hypothetical protein